MYCLSVLFGNWFSDCILCIVSVCIVFGISIGTKVSLDLNHWNLNDLCWPPDFIFALCGKKHLKEAVHKKNGGNFFSAEAFMIVELLKLVSDFKKMSWNLTWGFWGFPYDCSVWVVNIWQVLHGDRICFGWYWRGRWRFSVSTNLYKILKPQDLLVCAVKFWD